jgi:DNA-binding NarL/FixJ family response regulator
VIAEDFAELNTIYAGILGREPDLEVVGRASSAADLLDLLETTPADVVLMDIEMEHPTSGIVACRRLVDLHPGTKVVVLTCHEEEDKVLAAFEAGAVDYILKTDSITDVVKAIKGAHHRNAPIHPFAAQALRRTMQDMGRYKNNLKSIIQRLSVLTPSETAILSLLLDGTKLKDIARLRNIELVTVKAHVTSILRKFEAKSTSTVVAELKETGLDQFLPGFSR